MHYIHLTPIFLSISYSVAQDPISTTLSASSRVSVESLETSAPGVISPEYVLRGFDGCDDDQIAAIKNGFADMITLLMRNEIGLYRGVDWNSAAAQDFWGSYEFNAEVRNHIKDNLDRAAAVGYQWWLNPFATRLHARCDDPLIQCVCNSQGFTNAYTVRHEPEINFCWHYFMLPTLSAALRRPIGGYWEYIDAFENTATTWAHELIHIRQIGHNIDDLHGAILDQPVQGWPGVFGKKSYGDKYTKWLAQNPGGIVGEMVDNADNYALFVTANYIQAKLDYYPSRRAMPIFPSGPNGLLELNATFEGASIEPSFNNYCYDGNY